MVESARSLVFNSLVCEDSESPIWSCADSASHPILMGPGFEMGMEGNAAYFVDGKGRTLKSRRFRQDSIGLEGENGSQEMVITLHETGERIRSFDSIGPHGAPKVAREFWVEPREAPFMYEGRYYRAERIRSRLWRRKTRFGGARAARLAPSIADAMHLDGITGLRALTTWHRIKLPKMNIHPQFNSEILKRLVGRARGRVGVKRMQATRRIGLNECLFVMPSG